LGVKFEGVAGHKEMTHTIDAFFDLTEI